MAREEEQVCIRLWEEESAFIYTLRRGGEMVETAVVGLSDPAEESLSGSAYYGGSEAMD